MMHDLINLCEEESKIIDALYLKVIQCGIDMGEEFDEMVSRTAKKLSKLREKVTV